MTPGTAVLADQLLAAPWSVGSTVGYQVLFVGVLFGSIVPVIPTGAVVGAGAAFAMTSDDLALPTVLLVVVAAAVLGDLVTFSVCRFGGPRLLRAIARRQDPHRIEQVRGQFRRHGWQIVVIGRLLPAGRIPVLLAAGALDYPWRRLVPATVAAATLWAIAYAALGVLSGGIFDSPFLAVTLATLLVLAVGVGTNWLSARRRRKEDGDSAEPDPEPDLEPDPAPDSTPAPSAPERP